MPLLNNVNEIGLYDLDSSESSSIMVVIFIGVFIFEQRDVISNNVIFLQV